MSGTLSFSQGRYHKSLTDYELQRLRNPQTAQDKEVFENLPADIQSQIKSKKVGLINLPLDFDKVSVVFYKKQDYEPFCSSDGVSRFGRYKF